MPRRNLAALLAGAILIAACSTTSATPSAESSADTESVAVAEATDLFDTSSVHSVSVEIDSTSYDAMIETYRTSGDKEWISATVIIDGTTFQQAGVRLKGNSSLRGLAGNGGNGGGMGAGAESSVSADDPTTLPWLIDLDKYIDGQAYGDVVEFVVRSNSTQTALNEAVALDLLAEAGLASQASVAVRFSVNGADEVLRLVVENPDDSWMATTLDSSGALYKAESTGDYSYRGGDPASYTDVFDQEAGKDNADLTPLIDFLEFINESTDADFAAGIADRLDVDSFATYLAMQDLLSNFDDIDGPGNNSYLYVDTDTGQFTVVPWDYNLAFGIGPGGGGNGGGFPGGGQMPNGGFPGGGQVPNGGELPEGFQPPAMGQGGVPGGGFGGGPGGGSNVLVQRFLAIDQYADLVADRTEDLRAELYDSGRAQEILDQLSAVISTDASDLVTPATVQSEAAQIAAAF